MDQHDVFNNPKEEKLVPDDLKKLLQMTEDIIENQDGILSTVNDRLDELCNNEKDNKELFEELFESTEGLRAFDRSALEVRADIYETTGDVTPDQIQEAYEESEEVDQALIRLREIKYAKLAKIAGEETVAWLKDNWFLLLPLGLIPWSAAAGGSVSTAVKISGALTTELLLLDKVIDAASENAKGVLPPAMLVLFLAGTTNLAELGVSQVSAIKGDPMETSAATPMGSNPVNMGMLAGAFLLMMSGRKKAMVMKKLGYDPNNEDDVRRFEQNHDKEAVAEMVKEIRILKGDIIKDIDWKMVTKQLGMSGVFAMSALAFTHYVSPSLYRGNPVPLLLWASVSAPLAAGYLFKTSFSHDARINGALNKVGRQHAQEMLTELEHIGDTFEQETTPLLELVKLVDEVREIDEIDSPTKEQKRDRSALLSIITQQIEDVAEAMETNDDFRTMIDLYLKSPQMRDMSTLMKSAGIDTEATLGRAIKSADLELVEQSLLGKDLNLSPEHATKLSLLLEEFGELKQQRSDLKAELDAAYESDEYPSVTAIEKAEKKMCRQLETLDGKIVKKTKAVQRCLASWERHIMKNEPARQELVAHVRNNPETARLLARGGMNLRKNADQVFTDFTDEHAHALEKLSRVHDISFDDTLFSLRARNVMYDENHVVEIHPIKELVSLLKEYKEASDSDIRDLIIADVNSLLKKIRAQIDEGGEFRTQLEEILHSKDGFPLLFIIEGTQTYEAVKRAKIKKILLCMGAAAAISYMMDMHLENLEEAVPSLDKTGAGYYVMAPLSSAGELMVSLKAFRQRRDEEAAKNMTDSNALNNLIAKLVVTSRTFKEAAI